MVPAVDEQRPLRRETVTGAGQDARQRDDGDQGGQQHQRDDEQHPHRHDRAGPRLQFARLGAAPVRRPKRDQGRLDAVEQVRDAGEVGQHVVAVEAQHGGS